MSLRENHRPEPVAVVLLHGLCGTADELLPLEGALHAAGFAPCRAFVEGYSYGGPEGAARPWQEWVDSVAALAGGLRARHGRVVLAGLSAGAALALATAMQGAPVDGLVLMSTTLRFDGWAVPAHHWLLPLALYTPLGRFWRYRERPPYGVKNERVRRWVERELQTRRVSAAGAAVIGVPHLREHDRLRRSVLRRLGAFACPPALALHAREDEIAGPSNVALLSARLRTPSFRAVLVEDSHHMITIDNDRARVAREVVGFVSALAAPAPSPVPSTAPSAGEPCHA
ncbi:MAG: alpha/beta fold hydrolase [Rubrivivax sp.]